MEFEKPSVTNAPAELQTPAREWREIIPPHIANANEGNNLKI